MLHAGPPQYTKSVHDGVIIAKNDKSSHTQSRTTASTNSLLKGSRKKTGIDSVCFVYVCIYVMYMCVCRMFQPWYDTKSKGSHISKDDDSLHTSSRSGVKKRTGK